MADRAVKQKLLIGSIIAAVALILAFFIWNAVRPPAPIESPTQPVNTTTEVEEEEQATDDIAEPTVTQAETPTIDPETLSTVAIEPLGITVSYVKGVPAFSYAVSKTEVGTEYAELSSEQLIGTKCTDDEGTFASIVKNPSSQEDQATLSLTKKIGTDTFGLSLPSATCTADATLFAQYQSAFKDAFGLLQAI